MTRVFRTAGVSNRISPGARADHLEKSYEPKQTSTPEEIACDEAERKMKRDSAHAWSGDPSKPAATEQEARDLLEAEGAAAWLPETERADAIKRSVRDAVSRRAAQADAVSRVRRGVARGR
jgi:hypothetical protein